MEYLAKFETVYEGDDSKKSYKRLHRWRYSPTAAYGNNEVHIHPYLPRRISVAEALAIQSLPKEFELPPGMTLSNMFKTVGKVLKEANEPQFHDLQTMFFPYSAVDELYALCQKRKLTNKAVNEGFLDCFMEQCLTGLTSLPLH